MNLMGKLKNFFSRKGPPRDIKLQYEAITLMLQEIQDDQKRTIEITEKILTMRNRVEMPPSLENLIAEQLNLAEQNKKTATRMMDFVRINNDFINAVYQDIGSIKRKMLSDKVEAEMRRKDDRNREPGNH